MEFLHGKTLAARLREGALQQVSEFRAIFLPVLEALGYAHERGIVHHDLKNLATALTPTIFQPLTQMTCLSLCAISTRSCCASITASIDL